jgi:hypothetical protein
MNTNMKHQPPKRYKVTIEYRTLESSDSTIMADTKEQAERFALSGWRASHTEKCIEPVVVGIVEL